MKNKKVFALILSLALAIGVGLPGTLALSADTDSTTETTASTDPTVTPTPEIAYTPAPTETPEATETPAPIETPRECSCGTETEVHAEGCPLYTAPAGEEKPEEISHIEGCTDGCTLDNCQCRCHVMSLFDRIMACTSLEEIDAVLDEATDQELTALTEEENRAIDAYIESLEPAPLPAVVIGENGDTPVSSEIVYPTVNYSYVAPFGAPVVGGAN